MTTLIFSDFEPSDDAYQQITALHNRFYPQWPVSVEHMRSGDERREAGRRFERTLLRDGDGALLGYGHVFHAPWVDIPDKLFVDVYIEPDLLGTDIEATFLARLIERARQVEATSVVSGTYEDRTRRVALLKRYGFELEVRFAKSEQVVAEFPRERIDAALERARSQGITFSTEVELRERHSDYVERAWEAAWACEQGMPSPDPPRQKPLPVFREWLETSPGRIPEATWFALDGERYVGLTTLERNGTEEDKLGVGFTGVRQGYRRRGIATALKSLATAYAQAQGVKVILTTNEESNPMYDLNVALGFRPTPAWVSFVKPLRSSDP